MTRCSDGCDVPLRRSLTTALREAAHNGSAASGLTKNREGPTAAQAAVRAAAALGAGEVRCAGTADRRDDGFSLHSTHCEAAGEMSRCTPFHMKAKGEAKT